jgi:hypothetical protein
MAQNNAAPFAAILAALTFVDKRLRVIFFVWSQAECSQADTDRWPANLVNDDRF